MSEPGFFKTRKTYHSARFLCFTSESVWKSAEQTRSQMQCVSKGERGSRRWGVLCSGCFLPRCCFVNMWVFVARLWCDTVLRLLVHLWCMYNTLTGCRHLVSPCNLIMAAHMVEGDRLSSSQAIIVGVHLMCVGTHEFVYLI